MLVPGFGICRSTIIRFLIVASDISVYCNPVSNLISTIAIDNENLKKNVAETSAPLNCYTDTYYKLGAYCRYKLGMIIHSRLKIELDDMTENTTLRHTQNSNTWTSLEFEKCRRSV